MKKLTLSDINNASGLKSFLTAYHSALHEEKGFPPLGLQKALHTAAHVFGFKNWQTMSAALD